MSSLNIKFLKIVQESLEKFLLTHPRSNEKLKPLHGNIKKDLFEKISRNDIKLISLDDNNNSEDIISGRYYKKAVDISIRKNDEIIGAIGIKFVMNNYMQNSNNYFENMLGETANIRSNNIPYFQILILFDKMPYFKNGGKLSKWEEISIETNLKKYIKLSKDDIEKYYHTPILTFLGILSLPSEITKDKTVIDKKSFNKKLLKFLKSEDLIVSYSSKFSQDIFKENVILNDYENFLNRIINFFLYKGIF